MVSNVKSLASLLALLCLTASDAAAQCAANYPFTTGCPLPAPGLNAAFNARSQHVASNAVLLNTSIADAPNGVWRDDYAVGFGAPPLFYQPSSLACSLSAGNGDNGFQVKSADNKCWLASPPSIGWNPRWWGLATPVNLYVATTGSDHANANSCLISSDPCATIAWAVTQAGKFSPNGQSITVNLGAGTFNQNLAVSGASFGFQASTPFLTAATSIPMLVFSGNGSATTTIAGQNIIAGQSYCYAILAQNKATIGLRNLSVSANSGGGTCGQSDLYGERDAAIYILGDVKLLGATGNLVSLEDGARLWVNSGDPTRCQLTLAGNANGNGINIDSQSQFWSDSEVCFANNPVFGGTLLLGDNSSTFKFFGNPGVTSGATITGSRFLLTGLSNLRMDYPPAVWPGTIGGADYGSRYEGPDNAVCLGGAAGCPNVTASTALGTGGSYVVAANSGAYAGTLTITMGTNALSLGNLQLGFPYVLTGGSCSASFGPGSGAWNALVSYTRSGLSSTGITFSWANNGVALTNGLTYFLNYNCQTGH